MEKRMATCTSSMMKNWEEKVAQTDSHGKEIDVHQELRALTEDIIVFEMQRELQEMAAKAEQSVFFPGSQ